jgi:hypothetical protein
MSTFIFIIVPIAVALFISLVDVTVFWALNKYNECLLNDTVEMGTQPDVNLSEDMFVSQPEIIKHLKKILQPHKDQSY